MKKIMRNQQASLKNLEQHVVQISRSLVECPQGSLPSKMEVNPPKSLKAIILRSGKELPPPYEKQFEPKSVVRKENELRKEKDSDWS